MTGYLAQDNAKEIGHDGAHNDTPLLLAGSFAQDTLHPFFGHGQAWALAQEGGSSGEVERLDVHPVNSIVPDGQIERGQETMEILSIGDQQGDARGRFFAKRGHEIPESIELALGHCGRRDHCACSVGLDGLLDCAQTDQKELLELVECDKEPFRGTELLSCASQGRKRRQVIIVVGFLFPVSEQLSLQAGKRIVVAANNDDVCSESTLGYMACVGLIVVIGFIRFGKPRTQVSIQQRGFTGA